MTWTTFAALSTAEMAFLDANYAALAQMGIVPCDMTGSSTITLTPILAGNGPPITTYANYQAFIAIANATNASAVSAQYSGLTPHPVYKDTPGGPVALTGGEIVILNACVLIYDSLLDTGAGGFHLVTGGAYAPPAKSVPAVVSAASGTVLTAAALTGSGSGQGVVVRTGPSSGFTDVTDTAADILTMVPGGGTAGAVWRTKIVNAGSETMTLSGGTSVTLSGVATIAGPGSADFVGVVTSGGVAVAMYR